MANPFQQAGSQSDKPPRFAPIWQNRFFTGLWTQRSPLRDPGTRVESLYYGGRNEALISGVNVELTNLLTLARRPGASQYSLQTVGEAINSFYSFKTFTTLTETIQVVMDGLTKLYTVSPASVTGIFTKSAGAGASSFLGINNTLYIGDGVEERAWSGTGTTRKWGIAAGGLSLTSAYAGTGATQSGVGVPTAQGPDSGTMTDSGMASTWGSEVWSIAGSPAVATAFIQVSDPSFGGPGIDGTNYLELTNLGFNIPSGSTISGVAVTLNKEELLPPPGNGNGFILDTGVFLVKAGTIETGWTDHSSATPWTESYYSPTTYGSSSDLWGSGGLTPADVNNAGFGVAIAAKTASVSFDPDTGQFITYINISNSTITVYYTPPNAPNWANPTNVQGAPNAAYTTAVPSNDLQTAGLLATNYGFSLSGTLLGVVVNITGHVSTGAPDTTLYAQLLDNNGSPMGAQKSVPFTSTGDVTVAFGNSSDLWASPVNATMASTSGFGVIITVSGNGQTFFIDAAQIQAYTAAITVGHTGSGSFTAVTGYTYAYAYVNSNINPPVFSNASPSASTGAFASAANATIGVVASPDSQVTGIWLFRTKDGGSVLQSLPTNPYPNTTTTINDNNADSTLNPNQLAAVSLQNSPPPSGATGTTFHMGRLWAFVNNVLYYATGPDLGNILGNPYESWSFANFFTLPSAITKTISTTVGLIVFTVSDIYIVYGNGSAVAAATGVSGITVFYVAPFIPGIGLLSRFAADVNGTTIYMHTSDGQLLSLDPSSGVSEIGFPIGAPNIAYPSDPSLQSFNPANSYLSWHVSGSQDKALYVSDGSTGWFRCNTSQAPEGGFVWSPKANIVGGCKAVQSIETSPGVHQLMIGPDVTTVTQLASPAIMGIAPDIGGSLPANTYYLVVTALDRFGGETLVSNVVSASLPSSVAEITITYVPDPRSISYRIWFGPTSGAQTQYFSTTDPATFTLSTIAGAMTGTLPVSNTTSLATAPILYRNLNVFADNGTTYPSNFTMGSIVLAYPGQMAELAFVTCDFNKIGTSPMVSILMNEISGTFSSLSGYVHSDPPQIYGTTTSPATLYSNRYDFQQSVNNDIPPPIFCRHMQIQVDFGSSDGVRNEILSSTIYGAHWAEA